MNILALDTATPDLIVGVVCDGTTRSVTVSPDSRAHNELLVPTTLRMLDDANLTFADLNAIVVGIGPGPFTGLRVGMATAAAFGDARGIPVHGVPTHDAIAHNLGVVGSLLVVTDARRKEVYWSGYADGQRVSGPEVCAPAALSSEWDTVSVPPGLIPALHAELQERADLRHGRPEPADLVAVADLGAAPGPLEPLYLRRPDAKEPAAQPPSPALVRRSES